MTSTKKVNIWNERVNADVFVFTLPAEWCACLLGNNHCSPQWKNWPKVKTWMEELGVKHAFAASEVYQGLSEYDHPGSVVTTPCRDYQFSR